MKFNQIWDQTHDCFIAWEIDVWLFEPKYNPSAFDAFYLHKYDFS